MKLAVLASGGGTTFEHLLVSRRQGLFEHSISVLVTDNPRAGAVGIARRNGISVLCVEPRAFKNFSEWDRALMCALVAEGVDAVVLAGFLRKIGPSVLKAFPNRIINTHPSLLPKFGGKGMYGLRVHEAVVSGGESETGVTIHLLNEEYDRGPILKQARLGVLPGETAQDLQERVKKLEKSLLVDFLMSWQLPSRGCRQALSVLGMRLSLLLRRKGGRVV